MRRIGYNNRHNLHILVYIRSVHTLTDNNKRSITLNMIITSGDHCINKYKYSIRYLYLSIQKVIKRIVTHRLHPN